MDPSSSNWIKKYFNDHDHYSSSPSTIQESYLKSRQIGLALGHTTQLQSYINIDTQQWNHEDLSKVALLNTLHQVHYLMTQNKSDKQFISDLNQFYTKIHKDNFSITQLIPSKKEISLRIETILESRIETKNKIINKNFYHIATNAILFSDVLAFIKHLTNKSITTAYFSKFEQAIVTIVSIVLQEKKDHNSHDKHFIRLYEDSLRYSNFDSITPHNLEQLDTTYFDNEIERYYLLDICILSLYSDRILDPSEINLIKTIATKLNLSQEHYQNSISSIYDFVSQHQSQIIYFDPKNPAKNFYNHTSRSILLLLKRNKKRIFKEFNNNKELMILTSKSTYSSLNKSEKKQLKKHLINLCKTIPSLAIFLLPGGSLVLPLLIKFIPQLLPSSFNENLDVNE